MDKAEALAYVSRMFDAAHAGAVLWGDALLIKRFISQCSRSGSEGHAGAAIGRFELQSSSAAGASSDPPPPASAGAGSRLSVEDWVAVLRDARLPTASG